MARNVYFSQSVKSEQRLLEDLIIESMKIYGQDVYYIPRKIIQLDRILNEDYLSSFEKAFKIEMYLENIDGFEGDGKLISKFGLEIRDQITLVVARRRWNTLIGRFGYTENSQRPREGDLIYFPLTQGLFEIKWVEDKMPFFQISNVPTFKLTCELFEYSNQNIATGVAEVDVVQNVSAISWRAYVDFENQGDEFQVDEFVAITLPSGVAGRAKYLGVKMMDNAHLVSVGALEFNDDQYHMLTVGTTFTGEVSGTIATVTEVLDLLDSNASTFVNDYTAQNASLEIEANDILDFDESNPFGDP